MPFVERRPGLDLEDTYGIYLHHIGYKIADPLLLPTHNCRATPGRVRGMILNYSRFKIYPVSIHKLQSLLPRLLQVYGNMQSLKKLEENLLKILHSLVREKDVGKLLNCLRFEMTVRAGSWPELVDKARPYLDINYWQGIGLTFPEIDSRVVIRRMNNIMLWGATNHIFRGCNGRHIPDRQKKY